MPIEAAPASPREAGPEGHERSTRALLELLEVGIVDVEARASETSTHALGRLAFTVTSNDAGAAVFLTRCLLPRDLAGGEAPHLRLFLCTGSAAPFRSPPAWNLPHTHARHRERLHLSEDGNLTALYDEARAWWMILDRRSRRALVWIADAARLPDWEAAAPFKQVLQWSLVGTSLSLVHGGVVAGPRGGALLAGAGGSGKSTTVAACLQAGFGVCGDDLVVVDRTEAWRAHALYDSIKLLPGAAVPPPPMLRDAPWMPCGDKRVVRYSDAAPGALKPSSPLHALLHCRISGNARTRLVPIPRAEMLRAIAPPTAFLLRGRETHILGELSALVRGLPCVRLELGRDPAEAAEFLGAWLERYASEVCDA